MPPLPPVTKALLLACVAIFCLDNYFPLLGIYGALWPLSSGRFMPWQVVTYAFLHGGVAHLFFNMLGLWLFGAELERYWGRNRYLQYLLVCVLSAAAAQLLVTLLAGSHAATVGASGALYGLLLAYALAFPRRQFDLVGFLPVLLLAVPVPMVNMIGFVLYIMLLTNRQAVPIPPMPVPAMMMVLLFGAIELLSGLLFRDGGIAHFAHLGGMLGGWLLLRYWRNQGPLRRR